jgi:hypothetical protein
MAVISRFLYWWSLSLALATASSGQVPQGIAAPEHPVSQRKAPPRQAAALPVTSSKVTAVPAFSYLGPVQCDGDGSLFFHSAIEQFDDAAIFKLAQPDDSKSRMFKLPTNLFEANVFLAFAVSPSGTLYVLTQDQENVFQVFNFDSDGEVKSDAKPDTPDHLFPVSLAVLGNEALFLAGYYLQDAPENLRGKGYAALFDSSGRLLRDLTNRFSLERADPDPAAAYRSIAIRSAPDGNLYLLKAHTVLVISQSGEVVRRLRFTAPDQNEVAADLRVTAGLVSIELEPPNPTERIRPKYLVLDAMTGREYGYFARPEQDKGLTVCFTREAGFSFLDNEKKHFRLITSALR